MPKPREVKLPVCPRCGAVGATPRRKGVKYACVGSTWKPHARTSMEPKLFREVVPENESEEQQ